ncbi:MAG: EpsI family protein [Verrucomicrobiae bacterium]|nr:EpsI family protein [Verrucomicrobiae bacterium]
MKSWRPYLVLIVLLAATLGLTAFAGKVTHVSEAGIVMSLPPRLGDWVGEPAEVTERERLGLPRDTEFERKRYWDAFGHEVYCSIVLAGKDSRSIHRPETCLPAQGWAILDARYENVPVDAPGLSSVTVRALKTFFRLPESKGAGGVTRLTYYWFVGKDRMTASHVQRIIWNSLDRVLHNVNHRWAYLTVSSVVPPGATAEKNRILELQVRQLLRDFVGRLMPELKRSAPPAKS